MHQVKTGDLEKLGFLFERFKKPLFGFFYRSTRSPSVCEDLVQNVFLRILKYRLTFTGSGKFTTWMFHIAHNVINDYYSQNSRYQNIDEEHENIFDGEQEFSDTVVKDEEIILLNKALGKLPPAQREIIVMSKYQGLKYKDIGEIMNCTESNVKIKVFRAMNELRKIYLELEGNTT
jgi:RNA polymerase sigma-70 factor, ECF subfamily